MDPMRSEDEVRFGVVKSCCWMVVSMNHLNPPIANLMKNRSSMPNRGNIVPQDDLVRYGCFPSPPLDTAVSQAAAEMPVTPSQWLMAEDVRELGLVQYPTVV